MFRKRGERRRRIRINEERKIIRKVDIERKMDEESEEKENLIGEI